MRFLKQNTATRVTVGPFLDKTDGITPEVALTVTNEKLTLMVDDGGVPTLVLDAAPTASGGNNDMVHVTNDDAGFYDLELAAANVNYVGRAMLALTDAANHCPVFHEFMILPANVYDALMGADKLDVNADELGGTAQTGRDVGASVLLASGQLVFKKNVARANFAFPMFDSAGALKTGLTVTAAIRKDAGASFAALAGSVTEIGTTGWYTVDFAQAETNADTIAFSASASGAVPTCYTILTQA